jgi:predicted lipoprotein with Yx(FWY)xxD motif
MRPYVRTLAGFAGMVAVLLGAACGSSSGGTASTRPATSPSPAPSVLAKSETVSGSSMLILTDSKGMTLYLWKKDTGTGKVDCVGGCAAAWPPFVLPAGATTPVGGPGITGTLATETNPEGKGQQVTYNGWPLYYYAKDTAPGDTTGQGVNANWFVVTPGQPANT